MALSPRIEVRQNQSLVMTPQLQQALKLLHMSNLELAEYVAAEVEKNPLLELASPAAPSFPSARRTLGGGTEDALAGLAAAVTLYDHLRDQIGTMRAREIELEAALVLVDELDEDGYLRTPLSEVAARHRFTAAQIGAGLALLQSCDPPGIAARTLTECMALQLRDRNRLDPAIQALLDNLGLAAKGRMRELEEICGVDAADLSDMVSELRGLNVSPGSRFTADPVQIAVPDVHVTRAPGGTWAVELNTETLPRVLMNNAYAAQLRGPDATARQFVSECSAGASWLVRALEQRARTILRVASTIVTHQERFFEQGIGKLRPLTQRAVAEQLGLHESTVSRVTAGKYLACAQGTFELRHFFGSAIQAVAGGEAFSAASVQVRIRHLIGAEAETRALSDDKLVALLHGDGIEIARRTVAKYREAMGIPSSVERRRAKAARSRGQASASGTNGPAT